MGLLRKLHHRHAVSRPHWMVSSREQAGSRSRSRVCRFEHMESRELLSAAPSPIHLGTTYLEDSNKTDQSSVLQGTTTQVADLFEVSYNGGAEGTQLTTLTLQLDNTFFDTAPGGAGVYGSFPLSIVSHDGFEVTSSSVADGGMTLVLTFSGFNAGEKLVFSIDVDEQGNLQPNAVAEGAEIEGATLAASFTAPHTEDLAISDLVFYDAYGFTDTGLATLLPNDNYTNSAALAYVPTGTETGPVYTAGASDSAQQQPLATLSGTVYYDLNASNTQDTNDTGIAGVTITLLDAQGHAVATTSTDSAGNYAFADLSPGTYTVAETQPGDYVSVGNTLGTINGAPVSGTRPDADTLSGITLGYGEDCVGNDFAETKFATLSGHVYVDANNNGIMDSGETGIQAVEVTLLDGDGNVVAITSTDSTGYYHFDGLLTGTYAAAEAQPAGYYDGLDAAGTAGGVVYNDLIDEIALAGGVAATKYDFGELLPASISGTVYVELNNDTVIDANEPLLADVAIYLLDESGNIIASTTTDSQGRYSFTDLAPGVYGVEEVQPDGYLEYGNWVGSAGGQTDGIDRFVDVGLGSGVDGTDYNFAEIIPATISGYVFQDGPALVLEDGEPLPDIPSVRDGRLTSDDTPLVGVVLVLCDGSGVPLTDDQGNQITATTDADGYYEFTGLLPGVYSIVEIQPNGYVPGIDTAGTNGGLVVNSYATIDPDILATLALATDDAAIVRITINPGDTAAQYNFSEVLVTWENTPPDNPPVNPPPYLPPATPPPVLPPPTHWPGADYGPGGYAYAMAPQIDMQPMFGGSGGPGGYTWHLSVIDGGSPRTDAAGDEFSVHPQSIYFDATTWTGAEVNQGEWILADQNGVPIKRVRFGLRGAKPVTGDWDGSGYAKVGVFIEGTWFFDLNGDGVWDAGDLWAKLGHKNDQPVTGDWDGDGKSDIGIFGPAWIGDLRAAAADPGLPDAQNMLTGRQKNVPPDPADAAVGYRTMKRGEAGKMRSDVIDHVFQYGTKGDVAVTGDWNGDGISTIGIFRNGTWFLDMDGDGRWSPDDIVIEYGQEGDIPVVGDWTGDGIAKVGVYRNGKFHLDINNDHQLGSDDKVVELGGPGDRPAVGDWNGDGIDKVGVYHDGTASGVPTASVDSAPPAAEAAQPAVTE